MQAHEKEIKKLSDAELVSKLNILTTEERKITMEILHYLQEVEARRLYLARGFSSLIEYCIKALHYSEGAAYRRINAMRMIKTVSEVKKSLEMGTLSLSNAARVQNFLNMEKKSKNYTKQEKLELLKKVEQKSTRDCEKVLSAISPREHNAEKTRILTPTETELRITLSSETLDKIHKIKNLCSHKNINPSYAELIAMMADIALEKLDPLKQKSKQKPKLKPTQQLLKFQKSKEAFQHQKREESLPDQRSKEEIRQQDALANAASAPKLAQKDNMQKRYIPKAVKTFIWKRDRGQCTYIDSVTQKKCNSSFQVQIDHIRPLALQGKTEIENLRLLCAQHNRFAAIQKLGETKMANYLT